MRYGMIVKKTKRAVWVKWLDNPTVLDKYGVGTKRYFKAVYCVVATKLNFQKGGYRAYKRNGASTSI